MPREKSPERSGKSFWSSARIITAFILILGLILGVLIGHYFIEPTLGKDCVEGLRICKAQVQVLDEENDACYQQNYDLNRMLTACNYNLKRYQETA